MKVGSGCERWRSTHRTDLSGRRVQAGNGSGRVIGWSCDDESDGVRAAVDLDDDDSWAQDHMWLADPCYLRLVTEH